MHKQTFRNKCCFFRNKSCVTCCFFRYNPLSLSPYFLSFAPALIRPDMRIKERALNSVGPANPWPGGVIFSAEANLDDLPPAMQATHPEWQLSTAVISNGPGVHSTLTPLFVWPVSSLSSLSDPFGIECCISVLSYMVGCFSRLFAGNECEW